MEILFDRTNRDSRLNTVIRHTEILFDRTNRDSRLNQYCNTRHGNPIWPEIPDSTL